MARPPAEAATARPPVPPRKGPWTDQEDLQLVWFVRLFGERRWDFLAKESGLNRTGKSCRLRWVNYLHPGLKHGRMTPQEEHLILELHDKWGNRWSRIARRLPGRTDNEIKNYWRTHMRKKAQERKQSSSPSLSSLSASSNDVAAASSGKYLMVSGTGGSDGELKGYTMDQIWSEIALSESVSNLSFEEFDGSAACSMDCPPMNAASPLWEECSGPLWRMDDEDARMLSFHDCSLGA